MFLPLPTVYLDVLPKLYFHETSTHFWSNRDHLHLIIQNIDPPNYKSNYKYHETAIKPNQEMQVSKAFSNNGFMLNQFPDSTICGNKTKDHRCNNLLVKPQIFLFS